ncbi:hypothetical protein CDL12_26142 [Handroanthus impetiginosus]|uniref:NAC domain-containing protein n=1 Tax=Handroanthus impetiginosus TaxID=429701 RepID=A0A2G9G7S2_9LAMI|nr:hypothetical protein CDL12_26142 [Handroanthus impetiginosus]
MACPPVPVGAVEEATFEWRKLFPPGYRFQPMEEELLRRYLKDWRMLLPPGYRFRPTEEELLRHYLKRKIDNEPIALTEISEVELYHHNPQTLAERYPPIEDNGWFFFTPRERKYKNGLRPSRAAGTGFWKATGKDKPIEATTGTDKGAVLGYKKSLVFYQGKSPSGNKTHWIMHEYTLNRPRGHRRGSEDMKLDDWVLCRIYEKVVKSKDKNNQRQKDHENISPSTPACDESQSSEENEVNDGDDEEEGDPLVDNKMNPDQVLVIEDQKYLMGQENNSNYINDGVMTNNIMSSYEYGYNDPQTQSQNVVVATNYDQVPQFPVPTTRMEYGYNDPQTQAQNVVVATNYDQVPQFPVPTTRMDIDQHYSFINNINVGFEGNDNEATFDYGLNQQGCYLFGQMEEYVPIVSNYVNYEYEEKPPNIEGCSAGCSDVQVQKVANSSYDQSGPTASTTVEIVSNYVNYE